MANGENWYSEKGTYEELQAQALPRGQCT